MTDLLDEFSLQESYYLFAILRFSTLMDKQKHG